MDMRLAPDAVARLAPARARSARRGRSTSRYARGDATGGHVPGTARDADSRPTLGLLAACSFRRAWPKVVGLGGFAAYARAPRATSPLARPPIVRLRRRRSRRRCWHTQTSRRCAAMRRGSGPDHRPRSAASARSRRTRHRSCARACPSPRGTAEARAPRTDPRRRRREGPRRSTSTVSRPIRSARRSGPMGCASPRCIAVSMSSRSRTRARTAGSRRTGTESAGG